MQSPSVDRCASIDEYRVVKRSSEPGRGDNSRLRTRIEDTPQTIVVTWMGAIDENADLEGVFAQLTRDSRFDMQAVERINSMGVHRWIPLVTRFSAAHQLAIEHISYALVQNANVVANLFGSARVTSCMAPYYCPKCKTNVTIGVSEEEVVAAQHQPPTKHCSGCGSVLEFDELDGYFQFFKTRR